MDKKTDFQELEQMIFDYFCSLACQVTVQILEAEDDTLMRNRDRARYRLKRSVQTTIKTMYGDVEYKRRYYLDKNTGKHVYLLDETLGMNSIGLYSTNMVARIADACISQSYGRAAEAVNQMTGQNLSRTSCWKIMQKLGSGIEEKEIEETHEKKDVKVIFEETDGVYLRCQLPDKRSGKKIEAKLYTIYEGWKKDNPERLANKTVLGGVCTGAELRSRRNKILNNLYNIDEVEYRILNGDGAAWIDNMADADMVYQLDRFHVLDYINRYIKDDKHRRKIKRLLYECKIEKMLEYIKMYADSIDGDKNEEAENVRILYKYLKNHEDNILSYKDRGLAIPEPAEGIIYKNPGIQENQNCTLITMRMKRRRMRWSASGANNLIKVICAKENGQLSEYIHDLDGEIITDELKENIEKNISAAAIPIKVGKGNNKYAELISHTVPAASAATPIGEFLRKIMA